MEYVITVAVLVLVILAILVCVKHWLNDRVRDRAYDLLKHEVRVIRLMACLTRHTVMIHLNWSHDGLTVTLDGALIDSLVKLHTLEVLSRSTTQIHNCLSFYIGIPGEDTVARYQSLIPPPVSILIPAAQAKKIVDAGMVTIYVEYRLRDLDGTPPMVATIEVPLS